MQTTEAIRLRPHAAVVSLGSNLGDRLLNLRHAVHRLGRTARLARLSSVYESAPVAAPADSPDFLNMVAVVVTELGAEELLRLLLEIEAEGGRRRSTVNAPRTIDLDLLFYGGVMFRSPVLTLPHARYRDREFVMAPLRELGLGWSDPATGVPLARLRGEGAVRRVGRLY